MWIVASVLRISARGVEGGSPPHQSSSGDSARNILGI